LVTVPPEVESQTAHDFHVVVHSSHAERTVAPGHASDLRPPFQGLIQRPASTECKCSLGDLDFNVSLAANVVLAVGIIDDVDVEAPGVAVSHQGGLARGAERIDHPVDGPEVVLTPCKAVGDGVGRYSSQVEVPDHDHLLLALELLHAGPFPHGFLAPYRGWAVMRIRQDVAVVALDVALPERIVVRAGGEDTVHEVAWAVGSAVVNRLDLH